MVDACDAMTSNRLYRSAMSHENSTDVLERGAGHQCDPRLATEFIAFLPEEQSTLCSDSFREEDCA